MFPDSFGTTESSAGHQGGLIAWYENKEFNDVFFVFQDTIHNWKYDIGETILSLHPIEGGGIDEATVEIIEKQPRYGGLLVYEDESNFYIFQDDDANWQYNFGETIVKTFGSPVAVDGGVVAIDPDDNLWTFVDSNADWVFGSKVLLIQSKLEIGFG